MARVFQFGRLAYLRHVLMPYSLPSIVTGMRLSMGIAWMVIVAGEMLAGQRGHRLLRLGLLERPQPRRVVAAILLIGLVGLVLDIALLRLSPAQVALEEVRS